MAAMTSDKQSTDYFLPQLHVWVTEIVVVGHRSRSFNKQAFKSWNDTLKVKYVKENLLTNVTLLTLEWINKERQSLMNWFKDTNFS